MQWGQIFTIVGANIILMATTIGTTIAMFMWSRKEANDFHRQTLAMINKIQDEMKDFHGRLVAIEERNKK